MWKEKLEKIQYMKEKNMKRFNICQKKLEKIQYM